MRFFRSTDRDSNNHEVNVTPLIDVSLVLVVMLLLTTPLAFESSINVRGAAESARRARETERVPRVEIVLVSDSDVQVNRDVVARADLAGTLRPLIAASETHGVVVSCRTGVTHGAFVDVLDQAKMCGAAEIAVIER
ncbi:MAG TPA: biopolymer transporter ExbD [Candidatus Krumholzibacteria bacterium]|nr:biopolymer transporter ExbD [Candidatus Krumholzibacteria bacterium]